MCIWIDGGLSKACSVLRARLSPLGYRVICKTSLPDPLIIELASRIGCIIATTDRFMVFAARARGVDSIVYIDHHKVERKSARDLATLVIKLALGRKHS